jgi:hypothetical protein
MASRKKSARSDTGRARRATPRAGGDAVRLGAGRQLPPLVFVTQREKLVDNVGRDEADEFLRAVGAGHRLIELTAAEASSADAAAGRVRRELQGGQRPRGVVLLGGYDVVPAARVDCLPERLARRVERLQEDDEFIVWSDDIYGDLERDWLPELPVSRIPDGKSARLMRSALSAGPANAPEPRRGLRNVARPFADGIFEMLSGTEPLLQSLPTRSDQVPAYSLDGERVYLVLHGTDTNATLFWGETGGNGGAWPVAMKMKDVPARKGAVVFTGCCWGALIVLPKAVDVERTTILVHRDADSSIALKFLLEGAWAFVGCTGLHWSPSDAPYQYYAGPLHQEFWRLYNDDRKPPAEALFLAKLDYQSKIPHPHRRRGDSWEEAVEFKTLRQYTCLGLGW